MWSIFVYNYLFWTILQAEIMIWGYVLSYISTLKLPACFLFANASSELIHLDLANTDKKAVITDLDNWNSKAFLG